MSDCKQIYFKLKIIFLLLISFTATGFSQQIQLKGKVIDIKGEPVIGAVIFVKNTSNATYTDEKGNYQLFVESDQNTIVCSMVGYLKKESILDAESINTQNLNITLEIDPTTTFDAAVVMGKSKVRLVEESGFNVVAIDATPFHNASVNLTQVLDRTPGVKIKQEGGLGSKTNVSINGLSGQHVRFFIDGMPMDAMSSAFQLNNLPVNMADRIEVYKGVVPVNFGSDALGGAVNIVTKKMTGLYLDASYSYGSFNTHKTFINTGYTAKNGFTLQLSAYQNYSDNNYFVDVTVVDLETGLHSKDLYHVRRFHDKYHNETVIAKIGIVDKKFADQLLFGFTLGQEYDEIQHSAYLSTVYGDKFHTTTIIMPSVLYTKENFAVPGLQISLAANYNLGGGHSVDTSNRQYNWLGEWEKSNSKGEGEYTDYEYKDNNGTINANINYKLLPSAKLILNNVTNFYSREGDNSVVDDDFINQYPRVNDRNIFGVSLNNDFAKKISTSIFAKIYSYRASAYLDTISSDGVDNYVEVSKKESKYGYGFTATCFIVKSLQLKGNYELTCRLPVSEELFGQVFLDPVTNLDLRPESSHNFNVGFNLNQTIDQLHFLNVDVNFFYRKTSDFIRRNIDYSQGEESYENIELVKTPGIDAEIRYSYNNTYNCGINISYQEPRNFSLGSTYYDGLVPNQPNFFGNADAVYSFNDLGFNDSRLSLTYNLQFVYKFLNDWSSYKSADYVPTQWAHNISVVYSWGKGKYNVSADCKNLFDAKLYDNYSLQKPGRSFSIKLRYFIRNIN